nr:GH25 family lysozyme [uncultured Caproiciproducens sp.]
MSEKWIDVSAHQGSIDWPSVAASGVKGVVIRAGYGDSAAQIDKQFIANIKGALAAGLKVAVYWFSYADSVEDARKEFAVCKQIIESYRSKILFVASDYEYDSVKFYKRIHGQAPSNDLINQMVNTFLSAAESDGWGVMLYTNNDYRKNIFAPATITKWPIWLADYSGSPDVPCDMQQTGSTGQVNGISGNVDMNVAFKAYSSGTQTNNTPAPAPTPAAVSVMYRVRTAADGWLPEVTNLNDFAGNTGAITDVAVRVSVGSVKYRVHVVGGGWLPYVTGCNIHDESNGYAGSGKAIDAIEIYYSTPGSIRPCKRAQYRVAPCGGEYWSWQHDAETGNGQDGYAGSFGRAIDKLQITIE